MHCKDCGQKHDTTTVHCGMRPVRYPYKCPVCDGSGKVSRPPWVAGDQQYWGDSNTAPYTCNACQGTGVVWG